MTNRGEHSLKYRAHVITEESQEMAGVIVFIHALLPYIDQYVEAGQVQASNLAIRTALQRSAATSHDREAAVIRIRARTLSPHEQQRVKRNRRDGGS